MRPILLLSAALASTLTMACNDSSGPTAPAEPQSPSFSADVRRFAEPFFTTLVDESHGLVAVFGLSHDQLASLCSGQAVAFDQVDFVEVTRPDGSVKLSLHGRPRVTIYSLAGISELCDLTGATPLATGTAHFSHTDNDLFISGNRTNSWGENLGGTASGSGGRFLVRAKFRVTILRSGAGLLRNQEFSITPVGH